MPLHCYSHHEVLIPTVRKWRLWESPNCNKEGVGSRNADESKKIEIFLNFLDTMFIRQDFSKVHRRVDQIIKFWLITSMDCLDCRLLSYPLKNQTYQSAKLNHSTPVFQNCHLNLLLIASTWFINSDVA